MITSAVAFLPTGWFEGLFWGPRGPFCLSLVHMHMQQKNPYAPKGKGGGRATPTHPPDQRQAPPQRPPDIAEPSLASQSSASLSLTAEDSGDAADLNIIPQALDILASLASLGISDTLRDKVQDALSQLSEASFSVAGDSWSLGLASEQRQPGGAAGGKSAVQLSHVEQIYQKKMAALEGKLQMSRSIMRKLYYKNVQLEKEIQVHKVRGQRGHMGVGQRGHVGVGQRGHVGVGQRGHVGVGQRGHIGVGQRGHVGVGQRGHVGVGQWGHVGVGQRGHVGFVPCLSSLSWVSRPGLVA